MQRDLRDRDCQYGMVLSYYRGGERTGYGIAASQERKRFVIVYLCEQEIAMATFVPGENEEEGKICATDFYSYDMSHMIEILDFEQDANKSVEEIHNRIMSEIRQQKKEIMIEKAFAGMHKSVQQEPDLEYEFNEENLEKIREDANFVQEQLRVDVKA